MTAPQKFLRLLDAMPWGAILGFLGKVGFFLAERLNRLWMVWSAHRGTQRAPTHLHAVARELERREIAPRLPPLKGQIALHLRAAGADRLPPEPTGGECQALIEIVSSASGKKGEPLPRRQSVVAIPTGLPIKRGVADFVLDSFDPGSPASPAARWSELFRALKLGGRGILVAAHPFGALASPSKGEARPGFESFFKLFRDHGVGLGNIREVFVDSSARRLFVGEEGQAFFNRLKETPLLIIFFVSKIQVK